MEHAPPLAAFAALGHKDRLAVFRLLMRFAPQGARPTEIAAALDLRANTLSHHLADLERAGLITATRQGRSLCYTVRMAEVADLVAYLVQDCGGGRPDLLPALPELARGRVWNVLFICSGNSARSIFAEALLRDLGQGRFHAFSAGTNPAAAPNPFALEVLARGGHDTAELHSKSLSAVNGLPMDFVFTVCDLAAAEDCAPCPGQPLTAHWGLPDPAKATGTPAERALAFAASYGALRRRILAFAALPFEGLARLDLQQHIDRIGKN